jgi:hypothetical protein
VYRRSVRARRSEISSGGRHTCARLCRRSLHDTVRRDICFRGPFLSKMLTCKDIVDEKRRQEEADEEEEEAASLKQERERPAAPGAASPKGAFFRSSPRIKVSMEIFKNRKQNYFNVA